MSNISKNWNNFLIKEAREDQITAAIIKMVMSLIRHAGFEEMKSYGREKKRNDTGLAPVRFVLGKPRGRTEIEPTDIHFFPDGFSGVAAVGDWRSNTSVYNNRKEGDVFRLDDRQPGAKGQTSIAGRSLAKALRETNTPLDVLVVTLNPIVGKTDTRAFAVGAFMTTPVDSGDVEAFVRGEKTRLGRGIDYGQEVRMELNIFINTRAIKSQKDFEQALNELLLQLKQSIAHEITHNFHSRTPSSEYSTRDSKSGEHLGITKQIKSLITNELLPELPEGLGFLVTPYEIEALIRGFYVYSRASKIPLEDIIDAYLKETTLNKLEGGGLATHHGLDMTEKEAFDFIKNEVKPRWVKYLKAQLPCAIMSNGKPIGKCVEYDEKTGKKSEKITKDLKLGLSHEKIANMIWGDAIENFSKKTGRKKPKRKASTSFDGKRKATTQAPTVAKPTTSVSTTQPSTGQFGKTSTSKLDSSNFVMPKGL